MSSGVAPQLDDEVAEAVDNGGVLAKARLAMDVADGANPLRDATEITELLFERCEDRQSGQTGGVVALLEGEVTTYEPGHECRLPVERAVPRDVGKSGVDLDQLKVARRRERRRERQPQRLDLALDRHVVA